MFNTNKKVLNNGLRVVTVPMENTEAITLLVLVGVGSRYETKDINGISHFLEHLFFKGTKHRPNPGQVHKDLNKIGADYNAFTSKEVTGFWVKSSTKDFDTSLDIVSDILLEPLFLEEEIEKERNVILQEISMYEDEPRRKVIDILENTVYGDQPMGWDIAGTKEIVSNISKDKIVDYRNNNYLSENMVVVAAGNMDEEEVYKKVEDRFVEIKKGKNKESLEVKIDQKSPSIEIINKDFDQTHLALAAGGYSLYDKKRYIADVLSIILGGNTSSRLFDEIREKLGLAYYVFSWNELGLDHGYLGMSAGVPHEKLDKVIDKINEIMANIKDSGISDKELEFAKSFLRGQMALKFEASDEVASFVSAQELFHNEILTPEEIMKKIEKVNQDDILKVAKEIFTPEKINMAVLGKCNNKEKVEEQYKKNFYGI